nr:helix-hairpin-helix domain-containing protein [Synechococcus elongatus]
MNRAKYPEILQTLPGVNEAIAREIIHQRLLRGPYQDVADFQRRLQLPPEAIAQWLPFLRF